MQSNQHNRPYCLSRQLETLDSGASATIGTRPSCASLSVGLIGAAALLLLASGASAQARIEDAQQSPVMLVAPAPGNDFPPDYLRYRRNHPDAFQLKGGLTRWVDRAREQRELEAATPGAAGLVGGGTAVSGTVRVPVLPIQFSTATTPTPPSQAQIQSILFSGASGTATHYYAEVSYGALNLTGDVYPYTTVPQSDAYYANGKYGVIDTGIQATSGRVWELLRDTLLAADPTVDFRQYDNDGPDGLPNSGDDDGVVDLVAFLQPKVGAECNSTLTNNIWSHRSVYSGSPTFNPSHVAFTTNDPSANGGFITIDDYTMQSALNCGGQPLQIGTFCHEVGHIFGIPDLYDTDGTSQGLGYWCLMGSGNWNSPSSPAHMSAWVKAELGWITPTLLTDPAPTVDTQIPQVETNAVAIQLVTGNGEYFLIENRQPVGFDSQLTGCGLVVYHVDEAVMFARRQSNTVNTSEHCGLYTPQPQLHYGISVVQADNLCELEGNLSRGDAGDVFPGLTNNRTFDSTSNPRSDSYACPNPLSCTGSPTQLAVRNISNCGPTMTARINGLPLPSTNFSKLDVVFVIDNTGSYTDDYPMIAAQMPSIVSALTSQFSDIRFGLAIFRDFPFAPYGGGSDVPYTLRQPLTTAANFLTAITNLTTNQPPGGGSDGPEAQYEALFQVLYGYGRDLNGDTIAGNSTGEIAPSTTGWAAPFAGRHKVIYLLTDAPFHDSDSETAYPTGNVSLPESVGRNAVRAALASIPDSALTLFVMVAGYANSFIVPGQDGSLPGIPSSTLFNQSQELAILTGGGVQMIGRDSSGLADAIDISVSVLSNSDTTPPAAAPEPFCRGDGTGIACPCGNNGAAGHGCANSSVSAGALLSATGVSEVTHDSLVLTATSVTGSVAIFYQGASEATAAIIDDGIGCVGGPIIRLGTKSVSGGASTYPAAGDASIHVRGAIPPAGGIRYYQCYYRNATAFCTPATSNRTNGLIVGWAP